MSTFLKVSIISNVYFMRVSVMFDGQFCQELRAKHVHCQPNWYEVRRLEAEPPSSVRLPRDQLPALSRRDIGLD